ncbi:MAG TPA: hypothetical protein VI749_09215 [Candidatus Omnitrophota bacterium]|nr:hypothetical protein [Candidatus Omnitrophota bacterium]
MDTELLFYLILGAAGMLVAVVFVLLAKIRTLKKLLAEEKRKRTFPLLTFEVDRENLKAYLKNESYCYAKDVKIDDLPITVDYGFKKELILKFEPLVLLRPNGRMELEYKVFDNNFDVTAGSPGSLVLQFHDNPFKMRLHYKNLEEEHFESTIVWDINQYVVKDVNPFDAPR